MGVSLESLLESRDRRRCRQLELIGTYPDLALVSLTVNIPGSEKRTPESVGTGNAGTEALILAFGDKIRHIERYDRETGFEAFLLVDIGREDAKRTAVEIEEEHPLGRIMDIDVIGADGVPLSRECFGHPGRKCMLCDKPARICMRSGTHTTDELLSFIKYKWDEYVRGF